MSRRGKIARLPVKIREELNSRLQDGASGGDLVAWLNALPEVRPVLDADFGGKDITESNLSDWRAGGFRDWERQQAALAEAGRVLEEGRELKGKREMADELAAWITARYIMATRRLLDKMESGDDDGAWKLLREMCHDVAVLRRGDHGGEWVRIEWEKQKLRAKRLREELRPAKPEIARKLALSEEEKEARWRQIFGMAPKKTTTWDEHKKESSSSQGPDDPGAQEVVPATPVVELRDAG